MQVTIDERIQRDAKLKDAVTKGNALLEGVLGQSLVPVSAEWSVASEGSAPHVLLTLRDSADSVSRQYALPDLSDPEEGPSKMRFHWNALLGQRMRRLLDGLHHKIAELDREEAASASSN